MYEDKLEIILVNYTNSFKEYFFFGFMLEELLYDPDILNLTFNSCRYILRLFDSFAYKIYMNEGTETELERRIMKFMEKADSIGEEDFELSHRFISQATRLYHENLGGYSRSIDRRFNEIFISFMKKYPSDFF